MKKIALSVLLIAILLLCACSNGGGISSSTPTPVTPTATEAPADITEKTDYVTEQWVAVEISFKANKKTNNITETILDVTFTNRATGTKMEIPGFWDGDNNWRVRFAPTECGIWDYTTASTGEDVGINEIKGTVACNAYKGDLDVYKHGFVRTEPDKKYFVYDDGTPFFYLGDTHWAMPTEEIDSAGPNAGSIDTDSHFKYIVDRRVEQGFTVYQSEPIGAKYNVDDGKISANDIKGFQEMDRYFQYIAQKGLVHANALLVFPSSTSSEAFRNNVQALTRYWVARYGAYPVMWTLGQEVDDGTNFDEPLLVNTYKAMCVAIDEVDSYNSPISAHQLNSYNVTCAGGVPVAGIDAGSVNFDLKATLRNRVTRPSSFINVQGHSWWATQWRPTVHTQINFGIPRDYWKNGSNKPIVDYEARYHYLSAGDECARIQAYIPYFTGMCGIAYGGVDMWYYQSDYGLDNDSTDGLETTLLKDKLEIKWSDLINASISDELYLMRGFFENIGWWNLVPDFDDGNAFRNVEGKGGYYACAYDGNDVYAVYLYNRTTGSAGKLVNMDKNATYVAQWFDTRTGKYTLIDANLKADANGEYDVPAKPVADDMVLLVTKK